jgi:hypothetical protein
MTPQAAHPGGRAASRLADRPADNAPAAEAGPAIAGAAGLIGIHAGGMAGPTDRGTATPSRHFHPARFATTLANAPALRRHDAGHSMLFFDEETS